LLPFVAICCPAACPNANAPSDVGVEVHCGPCDAGTVLNESDCICEDIFECETDNGGCGENAICENAAKSGDEPTFICGEGLLDDGDGCELSLNSAYFDEYIKAHVVLGHFSASPCENITAHHL
jgi:hypothetical protein